MKKILNNILTLGVCSVLLFSCKKDDSNFVSYVGGKAPVLSGTANSATSDITLAKATSDAAALNLTWTNPDFQFSDGVSSQDVNYTVEVDTVGANFTNAAEVTVVGKDLGTAITQSQLNKVLTSEDFLNLKYGVSHNIEIRVVARMNTAKNPALVSNVLQFKATPYLDVVVPVPTAGTLWVVGNAFASGWSNPLPSPYDVSQKFTKVNDALYELVVTFVGGAGTGYKLIQQNGVWGTQYHALDGTAALLGKFELKDSDPQFPSPGIGTYKISVNFVTGKYTLTPQ